MNDELDDALARVREDFTLARGEFERARSPEVETLAQRLGELQQETLKARERAAKLEAQLVDLREEALDLEAKLEERGSGAAR